MGGELAPQEGRLSRLARALHQNGSVEERGAMQRYGKSPVEHVIQS
jgi:hypothetical protein